MADQDNTQDTNAERTDAAAPAASSRPRRSRRATRPAMTPDDRPALDVLAELGLSTDAPATEEPTVAVGTDDPGVEGAAADQSADDVVSDAADESETAAEDTEATADGDADHDDAEPASSAERDSAAEPDDSPRLPATALLFQAPDLTPRRRRRASAPAGPPTEDVATEEADVATSGESETAASEPAEEKTSGGRRGRGRGRRRGRRGGDAEQSTDDAEQSDTDSTSTAGATDGTADGDASEPADSSPTTPDAEDDASESPESPEGTEASGDGGDEDGDDTSPRRRRRRGGRGRKRKGGSGENEDAGSDAETETPAEESASESAPDEEQGEGGGSKRRRRRRSRSGSGDGDRSRDEVTALKGSTRLEAKRQRRREGRDANRRKAIITEAEFLARRESVERAMVVRERDGRTQIAVLEDDVLVEHFVAQKQQTSMVGNVYLGRVQNVLPSMEAAFVDLGRGRNAVLYAGEVNWDAAGMEGQPRRIEQALSSGDSVMVQVTKDPIGHKGARLTSQITLAGRYLVLVPSGAMTGISRKLPDTERNRLKKLLKEIVPDDQGVIVRTAAEGASEEELRRDVERLTKQWEDISTKAGRPSTSSPVLLKGEPELATRVVRDVFNEDFRSLTVQGDEAWKTIHDYVGSVAPDLAERLHHWTDTQDVFAAHRIDEQLSKGMDRKVWLPSGGSLVIDRTEAMTVVDVNTGKFTGSGGTLEETVTKNNLEAAEEVVRQLRLRDIGGIIVVDFIDMVLESNRDLVLRRLVECLGRDRTRHQVAEVTSLGLVQMTRKRVGQGLVEAFSTTCEHCHGRGYVLHDAPVESGSGHDHEDDQPRSGRGGRRSRRGGGNGNGNGGNGGGNNGSGNGGAEAAKVESQDPEQRAQVKATLAAIAAAAAHAHDEQHHEEGAPAPVSDAGAVVSETAGAGEDTSRAGIAVAEALAAASHDDPVADVVAEPSGEVVEVEETATDGAPEAGDDRTAVDDVETAGASEAAAEDATSTEETVSDDAAVEAAVVDAVAEEVQPQGDGGSEPADVVEVGEASDAEAEQPES